MTTASATRVSDSICYMCTASCPVKVHVEDGRAVRVEMANPKNAHCPRWKAMLDFVYHPDRLRYPVIRSGPRGSGAWERISWDEALDSIADNLDRVKTAFGPESVIFWIAYTKEPRPFFHRLAHAFGSPNYCTESSNCFSGTWIASNLTYGDEYNYMAGYGAAVDPATKCKLVWGAAAISAVSSWQDNIDAIERGVPYIVVDPRRTAIASRARIHLQLRPGTDGALALGFMNVIINENLYDKEFVRDWTVGFDDLVELAKAYPPEKAAAIAGVPVDDLVAAARLYATTKPARLHLSSNSTTHHANGVNNHRAVILLAALTGNIDVPGGNRPPDYHDAHSADVTLHDERIADLPPGIGSKRFPVWTARYREMQSNAIADQIESADPYPLKAMFSAGLCAQFFANTKRFERLMNTLDFVAVTEYFQTPGTRMADIVLPIASWLERPILSADGPVARLIQPAIEPLGECRTEFDIYAALAERLGFGDLFWHGDFGAAVDAIVAPLGMTYRELAADPSGIPTAVTPRPPRSYEKHGFRTASGKVEIKSSVLEEVGQDALPVYREPPESPVSNPGLAKDYPLVLTSGARVLAYTHSQFRNIPALRKLMRDPLVDIHPADAAARGITAGDTVTVSTPRNTITMKANVTDAIKEGVVSLPHHWPDEANVNSLVNDVTLDPVSGFIPCKSQLCQVAKA
jgi:anaerobic selenocysteine-containing dehydrogenase